MRIKKATSFRRTAASMLVWIFLAPAISTAGQFDALYAGLSEANNSDLVTWQQLYPDLDKEIRNAFAQGQGVGDFLFQSKQIPVAWNVTKSRDIEVNSIRVGYFRSLTKPNSRDPLFPGLSIDSQNIKISAGNDLIVSPIPVLEGGFGYALSVDPEQEAILSAAKRIILMGPRVGPISTFFDEMSIGMSDGSRATLSADQILLFGGILANHGSFVKLAASDGIYLANGYERTVGISPRIILNGSQIEMDAPNIFVNQEIHIGQYQFGSAFPGFLRIGKNPQNGTTTNNVFFNKNVVAERGSELLIDAKNTIIFQQPLNLIWDAQANIRAKKIGLFKLILGDSHAHAHFRVTNGGYLYAYDPIDVGTSSHLTIDLEKGSVLSSVIDTHKDGDTVINMSPESSWYSDNDSNITSLSLAPSSYVQLGPKNEAVEIETKKLSGDGGIFYLASNSTGSLKITESSEGNHQVLIASTGSSLQDSHYIYHLVVDDASLNENDKAKFKLANNGIIDAGPYRYQLGLGEFRKTDGTDDSRVWVIVGKRSLKPTPPDDVITPPAPDTPKPDLPELPFDPDNPPPFNPSEEQPIGLSPAAKLTLASIASGNQVVQFLGTLDDLRSRMGEIRNGADDGLYFLYRHDKSRYHSNYSSTSRLKYSAFTFGGDYRLNRNWIVGGNLVLTRGKIHVKDVPGNHSRVDSVGAKFYAAWLGEKDQYVDTVLTVNRYSNKLHARSVDESTSKADYHNYGVGLSVEAGKRFYLPFGAKDDSWFIDPQVQLSYFRVSAASFRFSNDMKVHVDSANSLNGRIGFDFGRNFTGADGKNIGQVYLRAGVNHDFLGKTKVRMNEFSFKDHSIGTRVYYGIGGEGVISNKFKVFGQINRESGTRLKTDFQVKFGLKYLF